MLAKLFMVRSAHGFFPSDSRVFNLYPLTEGKRRISLEKSAAASRSLCAYVADAHDRKRRISRDAVEEASKQLCVLVKNAFVLKERA